MEEQVAARQWWQKKWVWITAGLLLFIGIVGSQSSEKDNVATPAPTVAVTQESKPSEGDEGPKANSAEALDTVGMRLDRAYDELEKAGFDVVAHDSYKSRMILMRSNWVVTDQAVNGRTVTLGAKKADDPDATSKATKSPLAEVTAPEPELTMGQRNAVGKAQSYLSFTNFSRTGLIEQLEYEEFDTADAEFAVDHLDVDWNEQAAGKAESYLEFTSFSRQGLIDQLLYEGFTQAQAEYGVKAVGY